MLYLVIYFPSITHLYAIKVCEPSSTSSLFKDRVRSRGLFIVDTMYTVYSVSRWRLTPSVLLCLLKRLCWLLCGTVL